MRASGSVVLEGGVNEVSFEREGRCGEYERIARGNGEREEEEEVEREGKW